MWYVMQVATGKEKRTRDLICKIVKDDVLQECFIPQYKVMKKFHGEWEECTEILLPGYIFIISEDIETLAEELTKVPAFARILRNSKQFIPLTTFETYFIESFAGNAERTIKMSEGIIEGDKIIILKGPLVNHTGIIKKIDRHKRIASLKIEMFGREINMRVGLEIVRKNEKQKL